MTTAYISYKNSYKDMFLTHVKPYSEPRVWQELHLHKTGYPLNQKSVRYPWRTKPEDSS